MVVETIARYGCASTAMCYTMHLGATAAACFRVEGNSALTDILSRLDKDVLIGTLSFSDPETGSHFWYPVSSKAERTMKGWRVNKRASWTTSGGFADWYIVQTTSPDFNGDYSNLSCFLLLKNEVKANPSAWNGLGLRGNQSGELLVDNVELLVMGPTNEVLRQFVGKMALLGIDSLDYWNQNINERALENEIKKMSPEQKLELAGRLTADAEK